MTLIHSLPVRLSALALAAVLSACGGGGADTKPAEPITRLVVMGDSLADQGTFGGVKATIQGHAVYPERIAQVYGLETSCNYFSFNGTTFVQNTATGCSNYAIGGGVINRYSSSYSAADPRTVGVQLAAASAGGNFAASDLLLIDGGGNDASALVGAYVRMAGDGGTAYKGLLGTLLSAEQMAVATADANSLAAAGRTYMQALADKFSSEITTLALDKGAQRVALVNMPGITNTPRFQTVLDRIAASRGGGEAGAAARAASEALFKSWIEAFNARLSANFAGDTRVAVVDLYTIFNHQVSYPAQYALTNVTTPACPQTGTDSSGLPSYTFATCTDENLAANPPAGETSPTWFEHYAFADGFHPSPYGHQLLSQLISRTLARAGWL